MNKLILATIAAMTLGTPLAFAANTPATVLPTNQTKTHMAASNLPGRCAALDAKFDKADAMHKASKYHEDAVALHTEGETLCSSNEPAAGVKYLAAALKIVAAEPKI